MKGFILSFQSEFYKSRKTLGFWSAILLPLLICLLVFIGFYTKSSAAAGMPGMQLWLMFSGIILHVLGPFLLPMFIVFIAYSVNSMEHKSDTWKTLFTLPISKWSIYAAKYFYALFLIFITLLLFLLFTLGLGNLLGLLRPDLKFAEYHMEGTLSLLYLKLFLSSFGIMSIQFLLSLLWADFLKPMGIGFLGTIAGIIAGNVKWEYAYLFPYSHPTLALEILPSRNPHAKTAATAVQLTVDLFTKDVYVGITVAFVVFFAGFFIVQRKSVK